MDRRVDQLTVLGGPQTQEVARTKLRVRCRADTNRSTAASGLFAASVQRGTNTIVTTGRRQRGKGPIPSRVTCSPIHLLCLPMFHRQGMGEAARLTCLLGCCDASPVKNASSILTFLSTPTVRLSKSQFLPKAHVIKNTANHGSDTLLCCFRLILEKFFA